jgi:hypothetical protein
MGINFKANLSKAENKVQTALILGKMGRHSEAVFKMIQCGKEPSLTAKIIFPEQSSEGKFRMHDRMI